MQQKIGLKPKIDRKTYEYLGPLRNVEVEEDEETTYWQKYYRNAKILSLIIDIMSIGRGIYHPEPTIRTGMVIFGILSLGILAYTTRETSNQQFVFIAALCTHASNEFLLWSDNNHLKDIKEMIEDDSTMMYDVANAMRGILIATMMIEVLLTNFINIPCEKFLIPLIIIPTYLGLN